MTLTQVDYTVLTRSLFCAMEYIRQFSGTKSDTCRLHRPLEQNIARTMVTTSNFVKTIYINSLLILITNDVI